MLFHHFRVYSRVRCSLKLFNFGLMINFFGLIRSGQNIIGSLQGRGHKIHYFSVRSGSVQKRAFWGRGAKNLAPQESSLNRLAALNLISPGLSFAVTFVRNTHLYANTLIFATWDVVSYIYTLGHTKS